MLRRYVHGASVDEALVWYEGPGTSDRRFLIADERGSIVAVTNSSGVVGDVNTYDAYGRPGDDNVGAFQYTGQIWIEELGLYYYKARFYNPDLGRFMQADPIGYGDGMNMYGYVGGDPVNGIDPRGTDTIVVTGTRIGCKGTCITDPDLIRDFLNSFNQSRNDNFDFGGGGGGGWGEEQPGKEDNCRDQQNYADPKRYVPADQLENVLQNGIENTSFRQFLSYPFARNGIQRDGPRYTATAGGWVDLQHVVSAGFSASGVVGLGEEVGYAVELAQGGYGLFRPNSSVGQSAFLASDYYSNSLGEAGSNAFYWGGFEGSLAQSMASQIIADGPLSQSDAQARADAACSAEGN